MIEKKKDKKVYFFIPFHPVSLPRHRKCYSHVFHITLKNDGCEHFSFVSGAAKRLLF